jgi:hypothetical protein
MPEAPSLPLITVLYMHAREATRGRAPPLSTATNRRFGLRPLAAAAVQGLPELR